MQASIFAVTGAPVFHSRSPQMMRAAFKACGLSHTYMRLAADSADEALAIARQMGLRGLNVTSPFKEQMYDALPGNGDRLGKLRSVNTVVFTGESASGFNTDTNGVAEALHANGVRLKNCAALVLGAGGAARAAVQALAEAGAKVTIANRTVEKAQAIGADFGAVSCGLSQAEIESVMRDAQVVVSCLNREAQVISPGLFRKGQVILDANYGGESSLVAAAKPAGALVIDGRDWLLHQGIPAFELFSGMKAPAEVMREALYASTPVKAPSVALTGFMGSGKTVVGRELSSLLNLELINLDDEIERRAGARIGEIFEKQGETRFREIESEVLAEAAARRSCLVSCGGGVVLKEANRELLKRNFITVWLWVTPQTVLKRLEGDQARPLLQGQDRNTAVRDLLAGRLWYYAEAADMVVSTESRSPAQIAEKIKNEICKAINY